MTEKDEMEKQDQTPAPNRRRNLILGLILAAAALSMYASIFFRLSVNPLE